MADIETPVGMEYKACPTEFKALPEEGKYEGYFSVIGVQDDGMPPDIVEAGAFAQTIIQRRNRIKVFLGHDWEKLIGPPPEQLREDAHGLFAAGHLTLGAFWGRETWELMKDGALTEGSFGYEAQDYFYDDMGVRHIKQLKLYEISPVPLGMNPFTNIRAVKALLSAYQKEANREALPRTEKEVDLLDECLAHLNGLLTGIKGGRVLSTANKERLESAISAITAALDALNELLLAAEPPKATAALNRLTRRMRLVGLALGGGGR